MTVFDIKPGRVLVMGILNATPDSFYDGGRHDRPDAGLACARQMIASGADIIDVGGESTRPGARGVSAAEESARVLPVLEALLRECPEARGGRVLVSVDTCKAEVAEAALGAGAGIINDISGLRADPAMAGLAARKGVPVVVMHMKGDPGNMQDDPVYTDVIAEIKQFFKERIAALKAAGVKEGNIILDPGIGFGKTTRHNLEILAGLKEFAEFGRPLLVGASRKSFIGRLLGGEKTPAPAEDRLAGSIAAAAWAAANGARILRVHDVKETVDALKVLDAVFASGAKRTGS